MRTTIAGSMILRPIVNSKITVARALGTFNSKFAADLPVDPGQVVCIESVLVGRVASSGTNLFVSSEISYG